MSLSISIVLKSLLTSTAIQVRFVRLTTTIIVTRRRRLTSIYHPDRFVFLVEDINGLSVVHSVHIRRGGFPITLILKSAMVDRDVNCLLSIEQCNRSTSASRHPGHFKDRPLSFSLSVKFASRHLVYFTYVFNSAAEYWRRYYQRGG